MKKNIKILNFIFLVSVSVIIFYLSTKNMKEIFEGAGEILEIFNGFSQAFIVSYMFFLIVEYYPFKRRYKNNCDSLFNNISNLVSNLSGFIDYSALVIYGVNDNQNNDQITGLIIYDPNFFTLKRRAVRGEKKLLFWQNFGSKIAIFDNMDEIKSFIVMKNNIIQLVDLIISNKEFSDDIVINEVYRIKENSIFQIIGTIDNVDEMIKMFKLRINEFEKLFLSYSKLLNYCNQNNIKCGQRW